MFDAKIEFQFKVLEIGEAGQITGYIAGGENMLMARGAYHEAIKLRPTRHIVLRDGARVIAQRIPEPRP